MKKMATAAALVPFLGTMQVLLMSMVSSSLKLVQKHYIEDNRNAKWCPAPGCDYAVDFLLLIVEVVTFPASAHITFNGIVQRELTFLLIAALWPIGF